MGASWEHRAPLNYLKLLSRIICGRVWRSYRSKYGRFASLSILRTMRWSCFRSVHLGERIGRLLLTACVQDAHISTNCDRPRQRSVPGNESSTGTGARRSLLAVNTPRHRCAQHADQARIRKAPDPQRTVMVQSHTFPLGQRQTERRQSVRLVVLLARLICVEQNRQVRVRDRR